MVIRNIKLAATPKTTKTGKNEQVLTRIVEKFNSRSKKDIKDWRKAMGAAENIDRPNRVLLYNLYDEIELDPHLTAVIEHGRRDKLFSEEYRVVDANGVEDKELTDLLKGEWFFDFCEHVINSRMWGHSLIQVGDVVEINGIKTIADVQLVPRRHVRPEYGEILQDQNDERGYPYRNDEAMMYWLVEVGKPRELGLYKKAAPIVLFKKNCIGAWSEYCEIFGMPMRVATTSSRSPEDLDRLEKELEKAGKSAAAVLNAGEDFKFIESTKGDAYNVYDKLIDRCNSELSKMVVGQTLTTDTGKTGTRAQGEVHERSGDDVTQSDKRLVAATANDKLFPLLEKRGFNVKGKRFEYNQKKDLSSLYERTIGFINAGYDVPEDEIKENFGITVTKREDGNTQTDPPAKPTDTPPAKPEKKKLSHDHSWLDGLYITCSCGNHKPLRLAAAKQTDLQNAADKLLVRIWDGDEVSFDAGMFTVTSQILTDALVSGWQNKRKLQLAYSSTVDLRIDYTSPDWETVLQMEANIFRFSAAKTLSLVNELNSKLPESKTFDDFKSNTQGLLSQYNENHLRTEYNFAWQTAQNAAEYNRMVAESDTYPYWQYITAGDGRVRPAHAKLDKMTFKADDPAFGLIYPPNDWGCRCYVKPLRSYSDSKLKSLQDAKEALTSVEVDDNGTTAFDRMKKNGMDINRAKQAVIFTQNQMYLKELGAKRNVTDNYGTDAFKFSEVTANAPERPVNITSIEQATDWYKQQQQDGKVILSDYNNRPIELTDKTFGKKTRQGSKYDNEKRYELVDLLPDILAKPDEVWYDGNNSTEKNHTYNYIKFYKGEMVLVPVELAAGELIRVKSFYLINNDTDRTGYLIKMAKK